MKVIALIFILLLLPILSNAEITFNSHSPTTIITDKLLESTKIVKLVIENDSVYFFNNPPAKESAIKKMLKQIKNGNFKYLFDRLIIQLKTLYKQVVVWLKYGHQRETSSLLFKTEIYDFKFPFQESIGASYLHDKDHQIVGQLLWMQEGLVDVAYVYSKTNLTSNVDSIKLNRKLFALSSATYFDLNNDPVGFQTQHGIRISAGINPNWDGLAIMEKGHLFVANLKNMELMTPADFLLEKTNQEKTYSINFNNPEISAAQMPLLAFNNQILVDENTAPYQLREMRFLCKIKQEGSEQVYLVLINFEKPEYLPNVIYSLFETLQGLHTKLFFALLLDVGSNNFFQVFNGNNQINPSFHGLIPMNKVNNVLVFRQRFPELNYQFDLQR